MSLLDVVKNSFAIELWPIVEVTLRSGLVFLVVAIFLRKLERVLSPHTVNRIYLGLIIYLGLLPFFPLIVPMAFDQEGTFVLATILIKDTPSLADLTDAGQSARSVLWKVYLLGISIGATTLIVSLHHLRKLRRSADFDLGDEDQHLLQETMKSCGMTRRVRLGLNSSQRSPVSFGAGNPIILVPEASAASLQRC